MSEHQLFKPKTFEEGQHEVVGDCNGITMQQRWEVETPLFADAILRYGYKGHILDYGCGVGRIAKEIIKKNCTIFLTGVDASDEMLKEATKYVNNDECFEPCRPIDLGDRKFDVVYLIYVLQHVPAIEIREVLTRIHSHLKDGGIFIYCSSDYRMAIRFDQAGFFDDRFLGVNLQEEVERLFEYKCELFDDAILEANPVLKTMIKGGLPHPAKVYTKKKINDYLSISKEGNIITEKKETEKQKLLLLNRLAPGDILVMTNVLRDLHKAYPNKYSVEVRSPCNEIFDNNPYITKLQYDEKKYHEIDNLFCKRTHQENDSLAKKLYDGDTSIIKQFVIPLDDVSVIDMHYPYIHTSGECGWHFSYGHREWLEHLLDIKIPQTSITPEIYLSQSEMSWLSPVTIKTGYTGKYWVLNAGSKTDFSLKQYPYYQEVVDLLKDKVKFVQVGIKSHTHTSINNTVDMLGKTNLRELFRTIYFAEGVITCVSLPMHVAAAFRKPCVVVAGAREGTRWELYPNQQFIYRNGTLPCAVYDGCWNSKPNECTRLEENIPKCMSLIKPEDVVRSVMLYYEGGMLS